ncbi:MurR/RpiR family transcriptional regulator [Celerinatantimonas sp. YJH-8]|uniref:MurR/RpiR family transcriptional regulator n=1 Tax=Celerinatantimonas sp. YJH-8 TaxID=3228714 RepID=UPI0038BE453B
MKNNYPDEPNSELSVRETIESSFSGQTPTGKKIATYLLGNLEQLPFETADSIAKSTQTSGISVGRYLRGIGYKNLEHLKQELRQSSPLANQAWVVTDRLDKYREQETVSRQALMLELDAIEYVYQLSTKPMFKKIAERLANAEAIFILGIQSTRGVAQIFFSHLEYLRPRVFYADGQSGSYVESLNSEFKDPYIIVTDTRAYSKTVKRFCQAAVKRNLSVALITDIYCSWARDYAIDLLQVKTATGQFWDSLAPFTYLFNLLLSSVVEQRNDTVGQRLTENRMLQKELGQFES